MMFTVGTSKKDARKMAEDEKAKTNDVDATVVVVTTAMIFSAGFLCGRHHTIATMRAQSEIIRNIAEAMK